MARVKKQQEEAGGGGSWALSYGDMMTLLLTFFILIVSFSTVELIKFRKAMGSLRGALGVLMEQDGDAIQSDAHSLNSQPMLKEEILLQALSEIEDKVFKIDAGAQAQMDIEVMKEGVGFRLNNELFFELGSATITPAFKRVLYQIGLLIKRFSCQVRVEGHTDDLPIRTAQFPSNWELSAVRAVSIVRYYVEEMGMDPKRFLATGYGQYQPLVPNDSPQNRQKNRRVEIYLNWENLSQNMGFEDQVIF